MTVRELIKHLQDLPDADKDRLVVMSKDEEGNGFKELAEMGRCSYKDWEIGLDVLTDELRGKGYSDEDLLPGGSPALCLWP